jgi:hypothetical protein
MVNDFKRDTFKTKKKVRMACTDRNDLQWQVATQASATSSVQKLTGQGPLMVMRSGGDGRPQQEYSLSGPAGRSAATIFWRSFNGEK